jgi:small subunit ribosomal protein S21
LKDSKAAGVTQGRGDKRMTSVTRRDNESIEDALKRFKRELRKVGVLREARKHEHYEKPSEIKKRKKAASARNKHRRAE